ncbi:maleylpyruvate isomerase family mycothiol-dependent enzyme [Streptomyces sp. RPT161]|uniref:maleylpyruvate isomerase family mycothiol-dependent enzyme n=1 Tax=Streptomyces sp. RPT161 TaxID=3015993 RepID=UPI0022B8D9BA|nr:maleylpyruvate isomerase family mycothiol-dependent enzyme [Streptomyces sp. RPT161]
MPSRSRKSRSYDPEKTRRALVAQAGAVAEAVRGLAPEAFQRRTRVGGWTVRELVAHLARQVEVMPRVLAAEAPAAADLTLTRWARSTASLADRLDADTREAADESPDVADRLTRAVAALEAAVAGPLPDRLVRITLGSLTAADFAVTRLVELVVHTDDLADATGLDIPVDRQALAATTRLLADALAEAAPGNSVELRVPPFAAVQCVTGPRHTRGTPPNVVETDPLTWIRMATGRLTWAEALDSARLSASGERADLSGYLPVLG